MRNFVRPVAAALGIAARAFRRRDRRVFAQASSRDGAAAKQQAAPPPSAEQPAPISRSR